MNLVSISLSNSILVNFFVTHSAQVKNSPMFNKNVFQSHFSQTVRECKKHVTPCFPTIFFLRTGLCMDIYICVYIYIYIYIYIYVSNNKHTAKKDYKLKEINISNTALRTRPCLYLQQGKVKMIKYIQVTKSKFKRKIIDCEFINFHC